MLLSAARAFLGMTRAQGASEAEAARRPPAACRGAGRWLFAFLSLLLPRGDRGGGPGQMWAQGRAGGRALPSRSGLGAAQ